MLNDRVTIVKLKISASGHNIKLIGNYENNSNHHRHSDNPRILQHRFTRLCGVASVAEEYNRMDWRPVLILVVENAENKIYRRKYKSRI
jgi:hypothetical protein